METSVLRLLLLLAVQVFSVLGYGEPDANGRPVWQERANHLFTNAVRIAPTQYKAKYMAGYSPSPASILSPSVYPPVPPLYFLSQLDESAYFHSNDMATHGCFQHPSCDGTDTFTRIESYYTCSGWMGENIAAGTQTPLDTENLWLCDAVNGACAADGSGESDGHRANIMDSNYKVMGVGYAVNSSNTSPYHYYWTQDFGGAACPTVPTNPIYSGSHYKPTSTVIKFLATYYVSSNVAPTSGSVVISGTSFPLSLDIGSGGQAVFQYNQTAGTACRPYYFTFTASSTTYRFPDTGCLVTYGEGSCTTSFDAACGGSSGTIAAATTAAAAGTTARATTGAVATTAAAATTARGVTTAAVTSGHVATTGSAGPYYVYSTSLQNGWSAVANSGVTIALATTYSSQACMSATLAASSSSSTNFFYYTTASPVTNIWSTLTFNAAASSASGVHVFFNNHIAISESLTTTWKTFSISFSSMGAPAQIGSASQLVFQNTGSNAFTIYLYNVQFS